jgi:hypothetical protein
VENYGVPISAGAIFLAKLMLMEGLIFIVRGDGGVDLG